MLFLFFKRLIEEYFDGKKNLMKLLTKTFTKFYEEDSGVYSWDTVKEIAKELPQKSLIPQRSFPKDITLAKVFLFALTSDKNKFEVASKEFLMSCTRFGLDCPFPFIKQFSDKGLSLNKEDNHTQNDDSSF